MSTNKSKKSKFNSGDLVVVKTGPYAGAEGIVTSVSRSKCGKLSMVRFLQLNGNTMSVSDEELAFANGSTRLKHLGRLDD